MLVTVCFIVTGINFPLASAQDYRLPAPGAIVHLSPSLNPPILKGIKVHPDNPFRFDFILDQGDGEITKNEATKLLKYFLASLTISEKDLWVNLSPYEKDRIIPNSFGLTEMGRDLLAEDYMLKQVTASLIYPEDEIGKRFWRRVYEEAAQKYGTSSIPVNTFNKVWIMPDKAVVYENATTGTAYVFESKLKVMLEQDYLSLQKHTAVRNDLASTGSNIVREIVIPELTKEVNEGKNFAKLRQVYNSLILATWYKKKIKDSILEQVYENKNKLAGISIDDPKEKERIYQQYLKAFKKGVFNYIKEEAPLGPLDPESKKQGILTRKYFSGGALFSNYAMVSAFSVKQISQRDLRMLPRGNLRIYDVKVAAAKSKAAEAEPVEQQVKAPQKQREFSLRNSFQWGPPKEIVLGRYDAVNKKVVLETDENAIHAFRSAFEDMQRSATPSQTKLEWLRPLVIYLASTTSSYFDSRGNRTVYRSEIGKDGEYFTKSIVTKVMNIPQDGRARSNLVNGIIKKILGFQDETIKHILSVAAAHLEKQYLSTWGDQINDWQNVEISFTVNAPEVFQLSGKTERTAVLRVDVAELLQGVSIYGSHFNKDSLSLDWTWNDIYSQIQHPTMFVGQNAEIVKEIVRVLSYMRRTVDFLYGVGYTEKPSAKEVFLQSFQRSVDSQGKNVRYVRLFGILGRIYKTEEKWKREYFVPDIARRIEAVRAFMASDQQLSQGEQIPTAFDEESLNQIEQLYEAYQRHQNDKITIYQEPKVEAPRPAVQVQKPTTAGVEWWKAEAQKPQKVDLVTEIYNGTPWWYGGEGSASAWTAIRKKLSRQERDQKTLWQNVGLAFGTVALAVGVVFWAVGTGVFHKSEQNNQPVPVEEYRPASPHKRGKMPPQPLWKSASDIGGGPSSVKVTANGDLVVEDASYPRLSKRLVIISGARFLPPDTMFSTRYFTTLEAGGVFTNPVLPAHTPVSGINQRVVLQTFLPALDANTRINLSLPNDWGVVEVKGPDNKTVDIDPQGRLRQPINAGVYTYTIAPANTDFDTQDVKKGNLDAEFKIIDNDPLFEEFRKVKNNPNSDFWDIRNAVNKLLGKYMSYNIDYNTKIGPIFTDMLVRKIKQDGYINSQCNIGSLMSYILFKYAGYDVVYTEGWLMGPNGLVEGDVGHATVLVKHHGHWIGFDSTGYMGLFLNNKKAEQEKEEGKAKEKAANEEVKKQPAKNKNKGSNTTKMLDNLVKNGKIIFLDEKMKKELSVFFGDQESVHHVKELSRIVNVSPGVHLYFFKDGTAPLLVNNNVPISIDNKDQQYRHAHVATQEEIKEADKAMLKREGGINFNADTINLQVQNAGEGKVFKFHLDPAQFAQLQNAPGFVPVIISEGPMTDLGIFFGLSAKAQNPNKA